MGPTADPPVVVGGTDLVSLLTWDANSFEECRQARRAYQRMRDRGFLAFQDDKPVVTFDPHIGQVRFKPRPNRYDRLTEDEDGNGCFDS